jgi:hypothetical protein
VPACGQGIARGAPGARPAHSPVARTRLHFNFQLRKGEEKRREETQYHDRPTVLHLAGVQDHHTFDRFDLESIDSSLLFFFSIEN